MAKRRTELDPFKTWLFDRGLERQTVYNYVSRVRAILGSTSSLTQEALEDTIIQLASSSFPQSAFRTPWRHYVDFMVSVEKVSLSMPTSKKKAYQKILYPEYVAKAAHTLIEDYHYTPKLLATCRWENFTPENVKGNWTMQHIDFPGERWYPPIESILTLFEWSAGKQPEQDTPLLAIRQDSKVALAPRGISKIISQWKHDQ